MLTHKQRPSQPLSHIIDAYWMAENTTSQDIQVPILPDGCIDIVMIDDAILLVGVMEFAFIETIDKGAFYLGIRFKAGVLGSLLAKDISTFNDQVIPLESVDKTLHETLSHLDKRDTHLYKTLDKIFEKSFASVSLDTRILEATQAIVSQQGDISTSTLAKMTNLSHKQLERLFRTHVGLTPKKYARIIRFIQTHKHLSHEGLENLCFKVLEKGYYDQAHFNREYKALTGLTPSSEAMSFFYNTD